MYTQTTSKIGFSASPKPRKSTIISFSIFLMQQLMIVDLRELSRCPKPIFEVVWVYQSFLQKFLYFLIFLISTVFADEDLKLSGSWLYWKQDGDEYAYAVIKEQGTFSDRHFDRESIHDIRFSWNQGYRIGIGKSDCYKDLDFDLIWTHFHSGSTSAVKVIGQEPEGAGIVKAVALPSFAQQSTLLLAGEEVHISGRDRFKYDVVDMEMGQWINFNDRIQIRPFLGVRIADLKESFRNELEIYTSLVLASTDIFVHNHTKFKGAGVLAGFDMDYYLCKGWSLFGRFAAAALQGYSHLKNHAKYDTGITFDAFDETIKEHYRQLKPILDLAIGLEYNACFLGCYPMLLKFAWEEHFIFRQLRYRVNGDFAADFETATATWTKTGTTCLQGITLTLELQF